MTKSAKPAHWEVLLEMVRMQYPTDDAIKACDCKMKHLKELFKEAEERITKKRHTVKMTN